MMSVIWLGLRARPKCVELKRLRTVHSLSDETDFYDEADEDDE